LLQLVASHVLEILNFAACACFDTRGGQFQKAGHRHQASDRQEDAVERAGRWDNDGALIIDCRLHRQRSTGNKPSQN
jgi:hypothetical protein